jgi:hypothetical protein
MRALFATLIASFSLYTLGCGEDLGVCDNPNQGRDTVLVGDVVMYGGQAIINKSCAGGRCHTSTATGELRSGAPLGLDFDLVPIPESEADGETRNKNGQTVVALTSRQRSGLQTRQQRIYDLRARIWDQVRWGMMPPPASQFSVFLELKSIFESDDETPCEKGKAYSSLRSTRGQEVLRTWLACGAPIVETNGSVIAADDDNPSGETGGYPGWQFPICEAEVTNPDGEPVAVSLETLLDGPLASCQTCHPASGPPDFSSLSKLAASFATDDEECDGKPYVTPGDPEKSYLIDILSKEDPGCGHKRMPMGMAPLSESQLAQVDAWIRAGAPTTDDDIDTAAASVSKE